MDDILAIDIGGSKISMGIVDRETGVVKAKIKKLLPKKYDVSTLLEIIYENAENLLQYNPVAIGVTIPGLADAQNGVWVYAPFSGIKNVNVGKLLGDKYSLPVYIENDVNACAIAEKIYGCCKAENDFLWVTVSNGIGGALFLNGKLYLGATNNAGEIGHLIVEENTDKKCGCGSYGCLEAMASGNAIEKSYQAATGKCLNGEAIAKAYADGDKNAKEIYALAGRYIGKALANCINILGINKIVLGGGVMQSFDIIYPYISEGINKYVFKAASEGLSVEKSGLGYEAALIGCAALCKRAKSPLNSGI